MRIAPARRFATSIHRTCYRWSSAHRIRAMRSRSTEPLQSPTQARGTSMFKNLFSIEGKTALVTGGSRGIGEMIAAGFVANGAKVYISSRKAAACEATAKRLSETLGG